MAVSGPSVRDSEERVPVRVARALVAVCLAACSSSHRPSEPFVGDPGAAGSGGGGIAGAAGTGVGPAGGSAEPPPDPGFDCGRSGRSRCIGETLRTCNPDGSFSDVPCGLDTVCFDTDFDARCVCPGGFQLVLDVGCRDIDECQSGAAGCGDLESCMNLIGGYSCGGCSPGYDDVLGDGSLCRDIDECAVGNGGCDPLASCTNTDGGHACGPCPWGHVGHGLFGCTPGLIGLDVWLDVWPGVIQPQFRTSTFDYGVEVPVLTETVMVTATAVDGASATIDGAAAASWISPRLGIGNTDRFSIVVSSAQTDSEALYSLGVYRAADPAYLKASSSSTGYTFGHRVATSGNTLVAAAPFAGPGGADVFELDDDGRWLATAHLTGDHIAAGDRFGHSVALSGGVIAIGAALDEGGSVSNSGAVYVFEFDGNAWTRSAYLKASDPGPGDEFGHSVAVFGDTIVVGAPHEDGSADAVVDSGAVYVFVRDGSGWTQRAYLKASNAGSGDGFGAGVALHEGTLVVAAPLEDSGSAGVNGVQADESAPDSGAAYVFVGAGDSWTQQAYLKASNPGGGGSDPVTDPGDQFGWGESLVGRAVAVYGDTIAIGAAEDSSAAGIGGEQNDESSFQSGAVYVFARTGTSWTQQAYIKASHPGGGDGFGLSLALWEQQLIVGAWQESGSGTGISGDPADNGTPSAGAAYVFERDAGTWSQRHYLKASNPDVEDHFGWSVAAANGTFVVGAPDEDSLATGVDGDMGNDGNAAGAVYVFR
jgi:hypothetical protein